MGCIQKSEVLGTVSRVTRVVNATVLSQNTMQNEPMGRLQYNSSLCAFWERRLPKRSQLLTLSMLRVQRRLYMHHSIGSSRSQR
eukprot:3544734-Amphidinium_carterae.1